MFKKIEKEIEDFTNTIKEAKGCDEMLTYVNSSFYSSIKLLMFASSTFSMYGRLMMFFIISSVGLLVSSTIGVVLISSTLLLGIVVFIFVLILLYITHYKKVLIISIENTKSQMIEEQK